MARIANMLTLASACLIGAAGPTLALEPKLQYNGVYRAAPDERGASYYLRFYPDGTVIAVTSTGQPTDLKQWFTPEHASVAVGKFAGKGNHIEFSVTSQGGLFSETSRVGAVDYDGSLDGNELRLSTLSRSNQHRENKTYVFTTWDAGTVRPTARSSAAGKSNPKNSKVKPPDELEGMIYLAMNVPGTSTLGISGYEIKLSQSTVVPSGWNLKTGEVAIGAKARFRVRGTIMKDTIVATEIVQLESVVEAPAQASAPR